jgi:hypothetical protein
MQGRPAAEGTLENGTIITPEKIETIDPITLKGAMGATTIQKQALSVADYAIRT